MSNSIVCDNKYRNFLEKTKVKKIIKYIKIESLILNN